MPVEGVDYAFPPRPDIAELARLGKKFACRYGGPGTLDKQLDPQEAKDLTAAGIAIVANAEGAANGLTGGWNAGVSWAQKAETRFRECGMPPNRPVYFSVDFDVVAEAWPAVAQALRGAASVLGGTHRVGVYGGRDAVKWARRDGVAAWFWQTYAWSGGIWVQGNHIEQYRNGVQLAGADCDLNRALQDDYGQWTTKPEGDTDMPFLAGIQGSPAVWLNTGGDTWLGVPDQAVLDQCTAQFGAVIWVPEGTWLPPKAPVPPVPGSGATPAEVDGIVRGALKDFGQGAAGGVTA